MNPFRRRHVVLTWIAPALAIGQTGFQGIGFLPGHDESEVEGRSISSDGMVVVGWSTDFVDTRAVLWSASGGLVGLDPVPGYLHSYATGVSTDGTVAGTSYNLEPDYCREPTLWSGGGAVGLGPDWCPSTYGMSDDESAVVGSAQYPEGPFAFRWTEPAGYISLGVLPGDDCSVGHGVSADGVVVVGYSAPPDTFCGVSMARAFRWSEQFGMEALGELPGYVASVAYGITPDAQLVVGYSRNSSTHAEACYWTAPGTVVGLGDLSGGNHFSLASDASSNGALIVGRATDESGEVAFLWDTARGMRLLQFVLENDYGFDLTGWHLTRARAVSDDGLTIAGIGTNPQGQTEGWVAKLPHCGDLDGDGGVDLEDFAIFASYLQGPNVLPPPGYGAADCEGDADVDLLDFAQFQAAFGG